MKRSDIDHRYNTCDKIRTLTKQFISILSAESLSVSDIIKCLRLARVMLKELNTKTEDGTA
jgi:hypothetical protein